MVATTNAFFVVGFLAGESFQTHDEKNARRGYQ